MLHRRPMNPDDIRRQVVVEELDLSGDGRLAVVVRRSVRGDRYVSHLYAIPLGAPGDSPAGRRVAGRPRRLTDGIVRDGSPRLAPDGRALAFVRSDPTQPDAPARLARLSLESGPVRLARPRAHGSLGEVAWSPDGTRLAFTAQVDPPRFPRRARAAR